MTALSNFVKTWEGSRKWTVHVIAMLLLSAGHYWFGVEGKDFAMWLAAIATSFTVGNASEHLSKR